MYPSNNSNISCTSQAIFQRPFLNNNNDTINSNSSSLFYFPSPHCEDDTLFLDHLHDLLPQPQPFTDDNHTITQTMIRKADSNNPRKRSSKKDRHSKINTASGPRDRRMRLSVDVARRFFDLQDMLGFDKASKTIEWLLMNSKTAIKELPQMKNCCHGGANSASSTSECEVVSGIDESAINGNQQETITKKAKTSCTKKKKTRTLRKTAFHPLVKESREKARARARERTREKRKLGESLEAMSHDLNRLGSWSPFETVEESVSKAEEPSSKERRLMETAEEIFGDYPVISGYWSPSAIFNYQPNAGIPHEHQLADFQIYGKTMEAYNNINLC